LDEPGVRAIRGDEAVRVIVEALLRTQGESVDESQVEPIIDAIKSYLSGRKLDRALFADEKLHEQFEDVSEASRILQRHILTEYVTAARVSRLLFATFSSSAYCLATP
jgi:2-phospho-L-lactate transferase/gluconeogenesis factor (CofD/UPF0052 family)